MEMDNLYLDTRLQNEGEMCFQIRFL